MFRALALSVTLMAGLSSAALAELKTGEHAPNFTAQGFLAGEAFEFNLETALQDGPVVLYFFPAAFTPGCNIEAALFAEHAEEFTAEGATLIGATSGNTDQLQEFSTAHCASAFPVAGVEGDVVRDYEVGMLMRPGWTKRTSYVIAPDGEILLAYSEMNPNEHVNQTLAAVRAWKAAHSE
ncbi:peroxiredoxin [Woodsholea maritima]|uniref:peroxiredoxin n=1 Tax=Woodsholea maritima TaxID=240237 RepID=UPI000375B642|nr:peroxiredoxin [Woodsholea maritima]